MDIQATKIELVKMILGIENPKIIERIKALVTTETSDFWDELTTDQQAEINQAMQELDKGDGIEWKEFKKSIQ